MAVEQNLQAAERAIRYVKSKVKRAYNVASDRLASYGGVDSLLETMKRGKATGHEFQPPTLRSNPLCRLCGRDMAVKDTPLGPFYICPAHPESKVAAPVSAVYDTDMALNSPVGAKLARLRQTHGSLPPVDGIQDSVEAIITAGVGNCSEQALVAFNYLEAIDPVRPIDYMIFSNRGGGYDHAWVVIGREGGSQLRWLATWGAEAVWCDPWQGDEGRYYSVAEFVRGGVRNLNWMYKLDTVEKVEAGLPNWVYRSE